jgi:hypothetical protein
VTLQSHRPNRLWLDRSTAKRIEDLGIILVEEARGENGHCKVLSVKHNIHDFFGNALREVWNRHTSNAAKHSSNLQHETRRSQNSNNLLGEFRSILDCLSKVHVFALIVPRNTVPLGIKYTRKGTSTALKFAKYIAIIIVNKC